MELTFVGTGSGKTSLERFHTSILISEQNHNLLIDTGDGISKALLASGISINSIDTIIISHTHADHFSGIASLLTQMKINKRNKPLLILIHSAFKDFLNDFIIASYLFTETIGFELQIIGYDFDQTIKITDTLKALPRRNDHIVKKNKIDRYDNLAYAASSFLIQINSLNLQYTADVGTKSDFLLFSDFNIDYLIAEATHIEFSEISEMVKIIKPMKCYLVHINNGEELQKSLINLSSKAKSNFVITKDGMKVDFSL